MAHSNIMFKGATAFNQDLRCWNITEGNNMFTDATAFNVGRSPSASFRDANACNTVDGGSDSAAATVSSEQFCITQESLPHDVRFDMTDKDDQATAVAVEEVLVNPTVDGKYDITDLLQGFDNDEASEAPADETADAKAARRAARKRRRRSAARRLRGKKLKMTIPPVKTGTLKKWRVKDYDETRNIRMIDEPVVDLEPVEVAAGETMYMNIEKATMRVKRDNSTTVVIVDVKEDEDGDTTGADITFPQGRAGCTLNEATTLCVRGGILYELAWIGSIAIAPSDIATMSCEDALGHFTTSTCTRSHSGRLYASNNTQVAIYGPCIELLSAVQGACSATPTC
jgi:hypothetical protein